MEIFIFSSLVTFLNIFIKTESELYIPFSNYKDPSINSIYGTGNRTLDNLYREKCAKLCGRKNYDDLYCCEGDTLEEEKCKSTKRCREILGIYQYFIVSIALSIYLLIIILIMIIAFIFFFFSTKNKDYKCKNAYSSAFIVLFSGTILPMLFLIIYCIKKKINFNIFFGAKFNDNIFIKNTPENENETKNIRYDNKPNIDNNINNVNEINIINSNNNNNLFTETEK